VSVQAAALVLAWVAIVVLAAGLAACVRALRFQEAKLARVVGQPARLSPGDRVRLPDEVRGGVAGGDVLLVFGKNDCRSCVAAVRRVADLVAGDPVTAGGLRVAALWRGPAPAPADRPGDDVVAHHEFQARAFEELRVGLLPTAVLASAGRVVAAGAVGSPAAVDELWAAVGDHRAAVGPVGAERSTAEREGEP
jgi:hypothetical protein